ncbi:MAG: polymer-forming cytoskeletal protein [Acidobacteriota bacterium]|jgi:cytoskeletal protein CcmA (bactofilin family)
MAWIRSEQDRGPGTGYMPDPPVDVVRERKGSMTQPAAHIGRTIQIKGEVQADEDLVVDGKVEGQIFVKKHRLTLGESGKVQGDIKARWIALSGEVNGNVHAGDRVEITSSGRVNGDINTPRLVITEGACIKGRITTDPIQGQKDARKKDQADRGQEQGRRQDQAEQAAGAGSAG